MNKVYKVGDKSQAICHNCKKVVPTTFRYRSVKVDSLHNETLLLTGVCDICDSVVSIPIQETQKIKRAINKK